MSNQMKATQQAKAFILGDSNVRRIVEMLPGGKALCEEFEREATETKSSSYVLDNDHVLMAQAVAAFYAAQLAKAGKASTENIKLFEGLQVKELHEQMEVQAGMINHFINTDNPYLDSTSMTPQIVCKINNLLNSGSAETEFYKPFTTSEDPIYRVAAQSGITADDFDRAEFRHIRILPYLKEIIIQGYARLDWQNRRAEGLKLDF